MRDGSIACNLRGGVDDSNIVVHGKHARHVAQERRFAAAWTAAATCTALCGEHNNNSRRKFAEASCLLITIMSRAVVVLLAAAGARGMVRPAPRPRAVQQLEAERRRLVGELARVDADLASASLDEHRRAHVRSAVGRGSSSSTFDAAFGYLSKSAGCYVDTQNASPQDGPAGPPSSFADLAIRNFIREFGELRRTLAGPRDGDAGHAEHAESPETTHIRAQLRKLVLSNDAVWAREKARPQVDAPLLLRAPYYFLCYLLDSAFDGRPIARFWCAQTSQLAHIRRSHATHTPSTWHRFLETVARMPYFSYISMLHLYESLGWWRRSAETKQARRRNHAAVSPRGGAMRP